WKPGAIDSAIPVLAGSQAIRLIQPNYQIEVKTQRSVPLRRGPLAEATGSSISLSQECRPNDQFHNELWGMGSARDPMAWCRVQASPLIVSVIDSGVDYRHEDLRENMWRNPNPTATAGLHGFDYVNNDTDPMDDQGHGTHCAGTIAAVGDNRL